jgi:magnesium chelatase family protein
MLAQVNSFALIGLDSTLVDVEVDISRGLPSQTIVGLPDAAVRESAERVRAALVNSGLVHPRARLTINLAPADLRKEGPAYDLPMAVGILLASEQVSADLSQAGLIGELSLDGHVRSVTGVLPMAVTAKEQGLTTLYVPEANAAEAALVEGLKVIPVAAWPAWWAICTATCPSRPTSIMLRRARRPFIQSISATSRGKSM